MTETLYKVTGPNGEPLHGGSGDWPLPRQTKDGRWLPGRWRKEKRAVLCVVGLHLTRENYLANWIPWATATDRAFTVWEAEGRGQPADVTDKICYPEARLLRPVLVVDEPAAIAVRRAGGRPSGIWEWERRLREVGMFASTRERPVFGQHRMPEPYAPAWPTPGAYDGQRYRAMIRRSGRILGISSKQDRATRSLAAHR